MNGAVVMEGAVMDEAVARRSGASAGAAWEHEDLIRYLARTSALSPGEAARVVAEVLGYFSEPADVYVRRRHRELKARGLTNDQVFRRIGEELPQRLVAAPEFTPRQLRRIVYG